MKIGVILGSTRQGRLGDRIGKWVMKEVKKFPEIEFELLDLMDYPLPFYNEITSPDALNGNYSTDIAKKWAHEVDECDAFIIITPEYNHGPAAVLKNALDYMYEEWNHKPVSFVSYSDGSAAGIRAVEQLRQIVGELEMADVQAALHIGHADTTYDEEGNMLSSEYDKRLKVVIDELLWWAYALKEARDKEK